MKDFITDYQTQLLKNLMLQFKGIIEKNKVAERIVNTIQCLERKENALSTFQTRLECGVDWEIYTIYKLQEILPDIEIQHNEGLNVESDIKVIFDNIEYGIEVKADYLSNETNNVYIKAKQYDYKTNSMKNSSLLSGVENGIWVHYYKENDKWFFFSIEKEKLYDLCVKYGYPKEIKPSGVTSQIGFLLSLHIVKQYLHPKPIDFTIRF